MLYILLSGCYPFGVPPDAREEQVDFVNKVVAGSFHSVDREYWDFSNAAQAMIMLIPVRMIRACALEHTHTVCPDRI